MLLGLFLPVVLAFLIGVIASFAVQGFIYFVDLAEKYIRGEESVLFGLPSEIFILTGPVVAGLLVGFIYKIASMQRWHGPAESILAAHAPGARPDTEGGLLSTLASAVINLSVN